MKLFGRGDFLMDKKEWSYRTEAIIENINICISKRYLAYENKDICIQKNIPGKSIEMRAF